MKQMITNKKSITVLLALAVLILAGVGVTLASGVLSTPESSEDFTVSVSSSVAANQVLTPGATVATTTTVTAKVSKSAWVYVAVCDRTDGLISYTMADGWSLLEDNNTPVTTEIDSEPCRVYYRAVTVPASSASQTVSYSVFAGNAITISAQADAETLTSLLTASEGESSTGSLLSFKTVAVQQEGFHTAADAFAGHGFDNGYTVTFVNGDTTLLTLTNQLYGSTPSYTGATPTKAPDAQYHYTFSGWDPAIETVTGNTTYTAVFTHTDHSLTRHDAQAATCTAIGWDAYDTCSACGYTTYAEIPALGHSWASPTWTWTWTETGTGYTTTAKFVCARDNTHTETVPATVTPATENATTTYTAQVTFAGQNYTATCQKTNATQSTQNGDTSTTTNTETVVKQEQVSDTTTVTQTTTTTNTVAERKSGDTTVSVAYTRNTDISTTTAVAGETPTTVQDSSVTSGVTFTAAPSRIDTVSNTLDLANVNTAVLAAVLMPESGSVSASVSLNVTQISSAPAAGSSPATVTFTAVPQITSGETTSVIPNADLTGNISLRLPIAAGLGVYAGDTVTVTHRSDSGDETISNVPVKADGENLYIELSVTHFSSFIVSCDGHRHMSSSAVEENRVEATCTAAGSYDSVVYCSVCHAEISREPKTIPALGHAYGEWTVTTRATCTTAGVETRVCANDASHTETQEIAALGHDLVHHEAKTATCMEIGWNAYDTCTRCDYSTYEEIAALGHAYGEWTVTTAATCTTAGVETRVCANDANHTETRELVSIGHAPAEAVRKNEAAATCTEEGSYDEVVYCSVCHEEISRETKTIPALGHSWPAPNAEAGLEWSWSDDYSTASLKLTCARDSSHTSEAQTATVTSAMANGTTKYTATVNFDNKTYTDTKEETLGEAQFSVKLPNVDEYLYRVGNQNAIDLGYLFEAVTGAEIASDKVQLDFTPVSSGDLTRNYIANTSNWTKGTIQFSGTGVVKLEISTSGTQKTSLYLEVIDAKNYPGTGSPSLSATGNNVCLLADTSTGNNTIEVSNGYTFYGNGFTIKNTSAGFSLNGGGMSTGYINVSGGSTLDNVKLDCAIYPKGYLYINYTPFGEYLTEPGNERTGVSSDSSKHYYNYQYSGVSVSGGSTVSNCYIKGARNNILINGSATIINTTCDRGSLANIHMKGSASDTVTLDNVTTIQYLSDDDFGAGKIVEGVGILVGDENGNNPKLVIDHALTQYNWVCSTDANSITSSSVAKTIVNTALNQSNYVHVSDGVDYVNMGVLVFNNQDCTIIDNREDHHYAKASINIMTGVTGQVYSVQQDYGTVEILNSDYAYTGSVNNVYIPLYTISGLPTEQPDESKQTYCWNDKGTIRIQFPYGDTYEFNVAEHIAFNRYSGENVSTTISCDGANTHGDIITFATSGTKEIVITVNGSEVFGGNGEQQGTQNYTLRVPVEVLTPDAAWLDATVTVNPDPNLTGVIINKSGDRYFWFDIFDGLTITDYDKEGNPSIVLNGADAKSKQSFIATIVSVSPSGDLLGRSSDYNTASTVNITLNDGRVLELSFKRIDSSNSPGGTKAVYLKTDSSKTSLYYVTNSASSSTPVTTNMNSKDFKTIYKIYDYKFIGNSGKQVTSNVEHVMATGLYNGTYTTPTTGTRPTTNFAPTVKYTITFDPNEGKCAQSVAYTSSTQATVTLPTPTRAGFSFDGWYTAASGGTKRGGAGGSYTPGTSETLYAHWKAPVTVTFDANGGNSVGSITDYSGTQISLPVATRENYWLDGWYNGEIFVGGAGDSYTIPEANIELVAQWSDNILVTFNGNGGTAGENRATYDNVTPITLPTATRAGHQFNGWYTAASGGTKVGNAGASYTPSEPTTLYAQWTAYTVSFDGNGATNPSDLTAGSDGSVTLPTPTRTGYTFNGWYTEASGGTKIGNGGASYTPTADITLHAQWTVNSYKVTITTSNSSTAVSVNGTTVNNNDSVAYNSVVKVVLSYTESSSLTFTIKQGNSNVTYYSNEACTSSTTSTAAGTYYFKMPAGNVTINSSSSAASSGGCVPSGTMITLADGSKKPVEEITLDDQVLVFNHETGRYDTAGVIFTEDDGVKEYAVLNLKFSDGSVTRLIEVHGYFDLDLMRYVYITEENYEDYLGHRFYKGSFDGERYQSETLTLTEAWVSREITGCYSFPSVYHLNFFADGFLSMPGGITGMFNFFEYDRNLKYNEEKMAEDIAAYGLLSYEDFADYMSYEEYTQYPAKYLNVSLGKGLMTPEWLEYLIGRYVVEKR